MTKDKNREAAVADAGPLIHLDELSCLRLLNCYKTVFVPKLVADEAERHRPGWRDRSPGIIKIIRVKRIEVEHIRAQIKTNLDAGELESLAIWKRLSSASIICDDLAARNTAKELGASVIGTLGLLIKSVRQDRLDCKAAISLIRSIPEITTLHIRRDLLDYATSEIECRFMADR